MKFVERADALAKRLERFVSGKTPDDPLYVSNRTAGQKIRIVALVGVPVLLTGAFVLLAMNHYFDPPVNTEAVTVAEKAKAPPKDVTTHVLPNLEKDYVPSADLSREIEVLQAIVGATDHVLSGRLRNNTDHVVRAADVIFDITDGEGSQLGGVAVRVENIAPKGIGTFQTTLQLPTARAALVREVHSR